MVAGFITVIALCLSGELMMGSGNPQSFLLHGRGWLILIDESPTATMATAHLNTEQLGEAPETTTDSRLPWWYGELHRPMLSSEHISYDLTRIAVGWPFAAFETGIELYSNVNDTVDVENQPLRVSWLGMMANVAIFSFAWLTLFRLPGAIRYARRRRRGLCPACSYNLHRAPTETCSECGTDQKQLRLRATRRRKQYAVIAIIVATIVAVPAAQAWHRDSEARRQFLAGGWLDQVADGHYDVTGDGYVELIEKVQTIEGHEELLAARLENSLERERGNLILFVTELVFFEPRESYVPLLDLCAAYPVERDTRWGLASYGHYPWGVTGERLIAIYDERGSEPFVADAINAAIGMSWRWYPQPEYRAEVESLLRRIVAEREGSTAAVHALRMLVSFEWINSREAREMLDALATHDPELGDAAFFEELIADIERLSDEE